MPRTFRQVVIATLIGIFASGSAFGQASQVPNAKQQFIGPTGAAYNAGKVFMYVPNTTTFKTTWQDAAQGASNTNPITLDSAGRAAIWGVGSYRQLVKDSLGNTIWDAVTVAPPSAATAASSGAGDFLPLGAMIPISGFTPPTNYVLAYGQAISRTTYVDALGAITISGTASCINGSFTIAGITSTAQMTVGNPIEASCIPSGSAITGIVTANSITVSNAAVVSGGTNIRVFPWGNGDGSTTFNVPDMRGRVVVGPTGMGGVTSSRVTSTYYLNDPHAPGVGGGSQLSVLAQPNFPPLTWPSTLGLNDPGHTHLYTAPDAPSSNYAFGGGSSVVVNRAGATSGSSATGMSITGSVTSGGSSTPFSNIPPSLTVNYVVKITNGTLPTVGVLSLGGMTGDILCGSGLTCTGGTVSASVFATLAYKNVFIGNSSNIATAYPIATLGQTIAAVEYGMVCNGVTDNTVALTAIINFLNTNSTINVTVVFPPGRCLWAGALPTINARGGTFKGVGNGYPLVGDLNSGTTFSYSNTTGNSFTLGASAQFFKFTDLNFWPVNHRTGTLTGGTVTGCEIYLADRANSTTIQNVNFYYSFASVCSEGAVFTYLENVYSFSAYSNAHFYTVWDSGSTNRTEGFYLRNTATYHGQRATPNPESNNSSLTIAATAYAYGAYTISNSIIWQQTTLAGCTSAGALLAVPAWTTSESLASMSVTDNACVWQWYSGAATAGLQVDSGSVHVEINPGTKLLQSAYAVNITDTNGGAPRQISICGLQADHQFLDTIRIDAGYKHSVGCNSRLESPALGRNVNVTANAQGNITIVSNTIFGAGLENIRFAVGAVQNIVSNNVVIGAGRVTANTYCNVIFENTATDYQVTSNNFGAAVEASGTPTYAFCDGSGNNRFVVKDNKTGAGNGTGFWSFLSGTGGEKVISDNEPMTGTQFYTSSDMSTFLCTAGIGGAEIGCWWGNANGLTVGSSMTAPGAGVLAAKNSVTVGVAGTSTGTFKASGITSGTVTVTAQAVAGSPILTLPNTSGTFAASAASPLAISATTGQATCATCATTAGANIPTLAQGDTLYASAANTLTALTKDTSATRYLSNTGSSNNPAWAQIALATGVSGTLQAAQFPALTGDVTTVAGALGTTIAANAVTNAKAAQMANSTIKCRTTAGTGNSEDCTGAQTSAIIGVPDNQSTTLTIDGASHTYTTASGVKALYVKACGPGGGGGSSGSASSAAGTAGSTGTVFGAFTGGVGGGGAASGAAYASTGGAVTGSPNISSTAGAGGAPSSGGVSNFGGGGGAASAMAPGGNGGGAGSDSASAGQLGSGGGGGGGSGTSASATGGASGACFEHMYTTIAATYSYTIGLGGAGATAGVAGFAGKAGGNGYIIAIGYR